jgi:hypothetical protein
MALCSATPCIQLCYGAVERYTVFSIVLWRCAALHRVFNCVTALCSATPCIQLCYGAVERYTVYSIVLWRCGALHRVFNCVMALWSATPCILVDKYESFGESAALWLHHQRRLIKSSRRKFVSYEGKGQREEAAVGGGALPLFLRTAISYRCPPNPIFSIFACALFPHVGLLFVP